MRCSDAGTGYGPARMAWLAIILLFVILGLGVLLVAMRAGGGRRRRAPRSERRTRALGIVAFLVTLLVLGVAVPIAVVAGVQARDDIPEANVSNLTEQEKVGRELFGEHCKNCHSLRAANAVAEVGPNLDQLRPPRELVLDAIEKGRARGNGQMAADLVEGGDAEAVAAFVAKAVGRSGE